MLTMRRQGISLVEILIVIAIVAILIGLLLPAIQKIRRAAVRIDDTNRMRQLALTTAQVADISAGELPRFPNRENLPNVKFANTPYPSLLRHTWRNSIDPNIELGNEGYKNRFFQSPADPSFANGPSSNMGHVSYAANAMVFKIGNTTSGSFPDGLSNTIFWSTHYARCAAGSFDFWNQEPSVHILGRTIPIGADPDTWEYNIWLPLNRRSSFADEDCGDAIPKAIEGQPPVAYGHSQHKKGSYYYAIMPQFAPSVEKCNPYVPNSFYADGILVAMGDGSVRFLSKSISEGTFWAAVTPAGGEILGDDW